MTNMMRFSNGLALTSLLALASLLALPMIAVAAPSPVPNALDPLLQCRKIADPAARVGCYDQQVDSLQKAQASNDVMVVNRKDVQQARRSIFGLALPTLSFLDRDSSGKPVEISEINAKISAASPGPSGLWRLTLDDGARWVQIEPHEFVRDPAPGLAIRIRKAAMGSFLANIAGQTAVRFERMR